jgi:hypothetical protein
MAPRAKRHTWRDAVEAAVDDPGAAVPSGRAQLELRRGTGAADRPGPLEFDAHGFPIPQPVPSFVRRVDRLLRER